MKKSAQAGIVHVALVVGLVILVAVGLYVAKNPPKFFDGTEAASNQGKFSNLSSVLGANSATFNFNFSSSASSFIVDVSTDSRMRKNTIYSPFGTGTSSPITVLSPQSLWNKYQCGATIYWRVNATSNGRNIKSSIQKGVVDCSITTPTPSPAFSPTPTPTGIGTTAPTSTPAPVGLAPSTANTTSLIASDGTWCYDYDGKSSSGNFNVGYSSQSFCQDNSGIHADYCESGTNTARDYYCSGTWDGTKWTTVKCAPGGYVCAVGSYIGDLCNNGACVPGNPPSAQSSSSQPSSYTLQGSDGTWCNDSDGNVDLFTKGSCQDSRGVFADYCNGSNNIQDYYCTGNWNGSSYKNVRCETGTHGCTSQVGYDINTGNPYICSDGRCILSSTNSTPVPAVTPSPTSTPTPLPSGTSTKRVFVTSTLNSGNLGGLAGADSKCQDRANAAGLGGTWKAWLSDSTTSASSRLNHFNGPYVRVDGVAVANDWTDLTDGTLQNPIRINEFKNDQYNMINAAWTGTQTSGATLTPNCSNWTDGTSGVQGILGGISSTISYWTVGASSTSICSNTIALYCFEQVSTTTSGNTGTGSSVLGISTIRAFLQNLLNLK